MAHVSPVSEQWNWKEIEKRIIVVCVDAFKGQHEDIFFAVCVVI